MQLVVKRTGHFCIGICQWDIRCLGSHLGKISIESNNRPFANPILVYGLHSNSALGFSTRVDSITGTRWPRSVIAQRDYRLLDGQLQQCHDLSATDLRMLETVDRLLLMIVVKPSLIKLSGIHHHYCGFGIFHQFIRSTINLSQDRGGGRLGCLWRKIQQN